VSLPGRQLPLQAFHLGLALGQHGQRHGFLALRARQVGIGRGALRQQGRLLALAAVAGRALGLLELLPGQGHGVRRVLVGVGAVGAFHRLLRGKQVGRGRILRHRAGAERRCARGHIQETS